MDAAPESQLRRLAHRALAPAEPDEVLAASLSLCAVANAFVMLGLLAEAAADAVLREASEAIAARGVRNPGFSTRSGAHNYWQLRSRGRGGLAWIPRAVGTGRVQLTMPAAEMQFEWLRISDAGVRFQVRAAAVGGELPPRHAGLALADISLADDAGRQYQMYWDRGSGNVALWVGEVVATPAPPVDVSWFELRSRGSAAAVRVVVPPAAPAPVGTAAPPWPSAAESYLALLCAQDPPLVAASIRQHVTAAVAEALFLTGTIPADSALLRRVLGREKRSAHPALPKTWPNPVRRTTEPDTEIPLSTALPFAAAAVVIEGLSAWGENVQLHLYGWPWVHGEQWPMAIPSFTLRAVDDLGLEHEGRLGSPRGYGDGEGRGDFTLWPAVPARVRRLHVVVSTLWESAWADIELPRDAG